MARISVYIIAYNEADKIEAALRSVTWADEILVADSHSTDGTAEIARRYTDRVMQVPFEGFGKLRNDVIEQLTGDWIFSLDADERCTAAAAEEIRRVIADPGAADAYLVPRCNFFFGRWIRHSGWYPDYRQPQLFRRGRLRYTTDAVHETYVLDGRLGKLREPIAQVPFRDLAQVVPAAGPAPLQGGGAARIGVVSAGAAYLSAREALPGAAFLKLGMIHPLPVEAIRALGEIGGGPLALDGSG